MVELGLQCRDIAARKGCTFVSFLPLVHLSSGRQSQCSSIPAGNDLNEDITPIQAGLKWTIGKNRRDSCDFLGGEVSFLLTPNSCATFAVQGRCDLYTSSGVAMIPSNRNATAAKEDASVSFTKVHSFLLYW